MTSNKQAAERVALVNDVIAAAEVAELAGFTGKQVWEHVRDIVMEMAEISETAAMSVIQEAKRQMATGPNESTVAKRLAQKLVYSTKYEKMLLAHPQDEDRAVLSTFISTLEVDEDTVYNETSTALEAIAEDGLEQVESEIDYHCDTPDDYAHDLFPWAQKNLSWCNKVTDRGVTGRTLVEVIRTAQVEAKQYIWQEVTKLVRKLEEEEEEANGQSDQQQPYFIPPRASKLTESERLDKARIWGRQHDVDDDQADVLADALGL